MSSIFRLGRLKGSRRRVHTTDNWTTAMRKAGLRLGEPDHANERQPIEVRLSALRDFETKLSDMVDDAHERHPGEQEEMLPIYALKALGFLPKHSGDKATKDARYQELAAVAGYLWLAGALLADATPDDALAETSDDGDDEPEFPPGSYLQEVADALIDHLPKKSKKHINRADAKAWRKHWVREWKASFRGKVTRDGWLQSSISANPAESDFEDAATTADTARAATAAGVGPGPSDDSRPKGKQAWRKPRAH